MTASSIPLADAATLRATGRRTRIIRLMLATAITATAIGAFLAARAPARAPTSLLPAGSSGIIVLDLSISVENETLNRMYTSLSNLAATHDRFGLVLFSSRAYEALPPNTPARELGPFARFFHATSTAPTQSGGQNTGQFGGGGAQFGQRAGYPSNPWSCCFSFGTEISKGLDLARSIVLANHIRRPTVWLMSDLADDPDDRPLVARTVKSYADLGIALRVVALNPTEDDKHFFAGLLGPGNRLVETSPPSRVRVAAEHGFPVDLAILAGVLGLLLAVNEIWSTPLRWGPARAAVSVDST